MSFVKRDINGSCPLVYVFECIAKYNDCYFPKCLIGNIFIVFQDNFGLIWQKAKSYHRKKWFLIKTAVTIIIEQSFAVDILLVAASLYS